MSYVSYAVSSSLRQVSTSVCKWLISGIALRNLLSTASSPKYPAPRLNLENMAPLSPSPFERLPNEILSSILLEVKVDSDASSFLQCLLCCTTLHDMAIPILYRDVLLTESNLSTFVRYFKSSYGPLLRSLTIAFNPVQPADTDIDEHRLELYGSQNAQVLWRLLHQLSYDVASMMRMTTFSLTISSNSCARGFWIPRCTIATIIRALPESCVNVEVDTRDYEEPVPKHVHLCDDIRAILPRLQNLRLSLTSMCPAIFMNDYEPLDPGEHQSSSKPVIAPFLKTFVVSCLPGSIFAYNQAGLCAPGWSPYQLDFRIWRDNTRFYSKDSQKYVITMVNAMWLSKEIASFPVAEHVSVLHPGRPGTTASLNRRNILECTTWAMPFGQLAIHNTNRFCISTAKNEEVVSDQWATRALAEGAIWVETMDGFRIPASTVTKKSSVYAQKKAPLVDAETWEANDPGINYEEWGVWGYDMGRRTRLLKADYRDGLSDMRPVGA